jgi:hypothetical protein
MIAQFETIERGGVRRICIPRLLVSAKAPPDFFFSPKRDPVGDPKARKKEKRKKKRSSKRNKAGSWSEEHCFLWRMTQKRGGISASGDGDLLPAAAYS